MARSTWGGIRISSRLVRCQSALPKLNVVGHLLLEPLTNFLGSFLERIFLLLQGRTLFRSRKGDIQFFFLGDKILVRFLLWAKIVRFKKKTESHKRIPRMSQRSPLKVM